MRIEIYKVTLEPTKLFSSGQGYDDYGEVVSFIGDTKEMTNIKTALDEALDEDSDRPSIYLKPWQYEKES